MAGRDFKFVECYTNWSRQNLVFVKTEYDETKIF